MAEQLDSSALASDPEAAIPRLKLSETGITGLKVLNKSIVEEANRAFQFPQFIKTVDEMKNNPTVAAALLIYRMMLGRVEWTVEAPVGATEEQKARAKFIESCTGDMEHSWASFITEITSYLEYGHAVHEKVFRRRLKRNGSKYNDGLVGIRKLPPRSQSTISGWKFNDTGRELLAVEQSLANIINGARFSNLSTVNGKIEIPRDKFLLFRADAMRDNPEGRSLLKGCYIAYKQLELIQNQEMIGIARDLGGVPCIGIHPRYMDPNASPEDKAVYEGFKQIAENLTTGAQSSVVMPLMYDPESKLPVFEMKLLESKGGKNFDTSAIIQRLQNDILTAMSCDVIRLGGNSGDSFSLAETKTNLLSLSLAYRLKEITEVLNSDLIPALFKANGWIDEQLPKFVPGDFDNISLEELSKYLQRTASTGLIELDRPVLNLVRTSMGLAPKPDDEPVDKEALTGATSRSGDSFDTPTGGLEGTRNSVSGKDNSSSNVENSA